MSTKKDDFTYLRVLAETLRHIPMTYGTDDGDIDRLQLIAARLEGKISYTDACPTCKSGEHVEEQGESGEFWWHCHQCEAPFEKVEVPLRGTWNPNDPPPRPR